MRNMINKMGILLGKRNKISLFDKGCLHGDETFGGIRIYDGNILK